jgi:hypothetical protein
MASRLVRRDQLNITAQGIPHKPTAAGFYAISGISALRNNARRLSGQAAQHSRF